MHKRLWWSLSAFGLVLMILILPVASRADTFTTTTSVDSQQGPWLVSLNPSYFYGVGGIPDATAPDVLSSANGLPFMAGDTITVTYLSGTVNGGNPNYYWVDANGSTSYAADNNLCGTYWGCYPSNYMDPSTYPIYVVALVGDFADNGVIVGTPFVLGDGPASLVIPSGANELQLGINDNVFWDNQGSLNVQVTETPEPASMLLVGTGLLGMAGALRRKILRA